MTRGLLDGLVTALPNDWLGEDPLIGSPDDQRRAYVTYLLRRLDAPRPWVEDAERMRLAAAA